MLCSSKSSLTKLAPLEAVLFDIDGTLCDSDPIHYYAFREMLQEVLFLFKSNIQNIDIIVFITILFLLNYKLAYD